MKRTFGILIAASVLAAHPALAMLDAGMNHFDVTAQRDQYIQNDVITALASEPAFQRQRITAEVDHRVVRLDGTVASADDRQLAEDIARRVSGADRVLNNITVVR